MWAKTSFAGCWAAHLPVCVWCVLPGLIPCWGMQEAAMVTGLIVNDVRQLVDGLSSCWQK